jgi:hypothetical protein
MCRKEIVLGLLHGFPNAPPSTLSELLDAAMRLPTAHAEFAQLAESVFTGAFRVDQRQLDLWLSAAYLPRADSLPEFRGGAGRCPT